jgi:hypothetical protein
MFNADQYGQEVTRILALHGAGEHLIPLTAGDCSSDEARRLIRASALPATLRAGLFFYFSCWTDAHEVAQNIDTREGSYWHALVHRQEPDASNAAYWFHRVGDFPTFPALREFAVAQGLSCRPTWDPNAFVGYCNAARPGSEEERRAQQIQLNEWQLLFDHCARARS